jgi:putative glutamine amidotransferase
VLARGMPLLAICRGTQETNVALGGTLHQAVHEVGGLADHRADDEAPAAGAVRPGAPGDVRPGGCWRASSASRASRSTRCTARA